MYFAPPWYSFKVPTLQAETSLTDQNKTTQSDRCYCVPTSM